MKIGDDFSIKSLIDKVHSRNPFLTKKEIIDFLINESLNEFPSIMQKVNLPDSKFLDFKRKSRLKRTKKGYRVYQSDKYISENELLNIYTKLQKLLRKPESNDTSDILLDGSSQSNIQVQKSEFIEFDGTTDFNLTIIDETKQSNIPVTPKYSEGKWIDKINYSIEKRYMKDETPLRPSIQSILGIIDLKESEETTN